MSDLVSASLPGDSMPGIYAVCGKFLQKQSLNGPISVDPQAPERWPGELFARAIAPMLREAFGMLATKDVRGLISLDRSLDESLGNACISSRGAGARLLRETSVVSGEKWYGNMLERGGGDFHFVTLYAARASLFFAGSDAAVRGYLFVEAICVGLEVEEQVSWMAQGLEIWRMQSGGERGLRAA